MKTREAFCTIEQKDTEHEVTIDANGDYVLTCPCGSFFKLPGTNDKKANDAALESHKAENEGKITLAALEKINEEKLKNI